MRKIYIRKNTFRDLKIKLSKIGHSGLFFIVVTVCVNFCALAQVADYSPLYTNANFTKTIDVSLPVGNIPATANVSSGAAIYSIPIVAPPGTNGVVPSISLNYNSMGGNSTLGVGWSISGLSLISRVPRTIYHDGSITPVDLNANQSFALDGARMILQTGNNVADGSTYKTEIENFATITSYNGGLPSAPGWFKVVTKDGVEMEYGNTADSKLRGNQFVVDGIFLGDYALFWRLNKITYLDGNYIEFKYDNSNQECRISEINYTGNTAANLLPYNKIKFDYGLRTDDNTQFEGGATISSSYLLDKITITTESGTQTSKSYQLKYGSDDINSFLKEIIESGSDGIALNSTIFKYGEVPNAFTPSTSDVVQGVEGDTYVADFNADGHADILSVDRKFQGQSLYHTKFTVYTKELTYVGSPDQYYVGGIQDLPVDYGFVKPFWIAQGTSFLTSDYTGDGADDILTVNIPSAGAANILTKLVLYRSTQTSNSPPIEFVASNINPPTGYNKINSSGKYVFPSDLNGDGVQDILTMLGNSSNTYAAHIYFGSISSTFGAVTISGTSYFDLNSWPTADQVHFLDFNGDGKGDMMLIKGVNCEIFTFDGLSARRIYYKNNFLSNSSRLFFGDFNGDRKTDVLALNTSNGVWTRALSSGKDFNQSSFTFQHTPTASANVYTGDQLVVSDFNGDGKADIYHGWQSSSLNSKLDVYYSTGTGFKYIQSSFAGNLGAPPPMVGDLNGDGRSDVINTTSYTTALDFFFFKKEGKELLLEKVANGFGHVTEWNYKKLTDANDFYKQGSLTLSPVNNIQVPLYAVSDFKPQNGLGGTSAIQFSYEEAKLHHAGKGFLGFNKIKASNLVTGVTTIAENELNTSYYAMAPRKNTTILTSGSVLLNETTIANQYVSPSAKRFWIKTTYLQEVNTLEGRTVTTDNIYDDVNGNITQSTVNNSNVETTVTNTLYEAHPGSILNKPVTITVAKTRSGQSVFTFTTKLGYNAIGQMDSKTDFFGLAKKVVTGYEYFPLGNLKKTTITGYDGATPLPAHSTSSEYDSKGRYPESSKNELDQTSSATYDPKWGKILTETGVDGLITTNQYDAFGRLKLISPPASPSYNITKTYGWGLSGEPLWYSQTVHPGKPDIKTWFDVLGREVKTETEGYASESIIQTQTYDVRGNVATSTQPYKSGETIITTTTLYDTHNRPYNIDSGPLGTTTIGYSYTSGNLTTTITTPTGTSSKTTDPSGQVINSTDNGGTLNYTYYSHGGLKEVKNGSTTLTSSLYDDYGRQTSLTDINSGTTSYIYDALGQLVSQTNANNQTHTMLYDVLGRNTSRTGPEGITSFEFYPSGSGTSTNQLKKVTGFAGNLDEYTYDALGRISTSKQTIDALPPNTTTYGYNNFADIISISYPSGFGTNHEYDANGYPTTIKNQTNTITLYSTTGINGQGQVKAYSLGNGQSSTITYTNGFPTQYLTAGKQNLNLSWNYQTGNLTSRNDAIKSQTESFTYDNLNRLKTTTIGSTTLTTNFTANGNISDKADAGTYTYHPTKINAVTGVTNPSPAPIPLLQQDITYTAFMQPYQIKENDSGGVPYELTYTYGADYGRIKSELKYNNVGTNTKYYYDGYEKDITGSTSQYIQYVNSPVGLIGIVLGSGSAPSDYKYVYTDHLGSILTITDNSGTVINEQNFDSWGRRRDPNSWALLAPTAATGLPFWLYRGYTGHEHLDNFGLINMNGRLYDPVVGRMLSPDNYIQSPGYTQSYNRYTYALNNPNVYTDPDGNNPIATIIFSAVASGLQNASAYREQGKNFWDGFWRGAIPGAVAGVAGYYAPTGFTDGIFYGIGVGAATGALNAGLNGGDIGEGILNGGINGGIYGGINSYFKGVEAVKYQRAPDNLIACDNCNPIDLNVVTIKGQRTPTHYISQIGIPFPVPALPAIPISGARTVHGNDNRNPNLHYVYEIIYFDKNSAYNDLSQTDLYTVEKYGISGKSNFSRVDTQVRRLQRAADANPLTAGRIYDRVILKQNVPGRPLAKFWETFYISSYFATHGELPAGNQFHKPWTW